MTTQNDRDVLNSILNPNLPLGEGVFDPEEKVTEVADEVDCDEQIKVLDKEAVSAAEAGKMEQALKLFDEIISLAPSRAASYNNRAQCLRLLGKPDQALLDLDQAILLSGGGRGRAGSAALCQRGVLYRKEGRDDDAMADFQVAAEEGSGFAKSMLVEMNPYAAMCNAMLKNVFTAMSNGGDNEKLMEKNLQNKSG